MCGGTEREGRTGGGRCEEVVEGRTEETGGTVVVRRVGGGDGENRFLHGVPIRAFMPSGPHARMPTGAHHR